jgi:DNA-binding response OmpR family regulator
MQQLSALVVEDDLDIASALVESLEAAGFAVTTAVNGRSAVEAAMAEAPDLVTLDLSLPLMDGIEVCRRIREVSDCYIVIISAREDEIDRLIGLEVGADDYILKPFSPRELRARVAALFRRPRGQLVDGSPPVEGAQDTRFAGRPQASASEGAVIRCGAGLVIHTDRREVRIDGTVVDVTRIEYDVLEHLASRLSRVCTREEMVMAIWSSALPHDNHLVDVHVANLRAKLRRHSSTRWIHTIRGIGYRLDIVADAPGPQGSVSPQADARSPLPVARFEHDDWS